MIYVIILSFIISNILSISLGVMLGGIVRESVEKAWREFIDKMEENEYRR